MKTQTFAIAFASIFLVALLGVPRMDAAGPATDPRFYSWRTNPSGDLAFVRLKIGALPTNEWAAVDAPPSVENPIIRSVPADLSGIYYDPANVYLLGSGLASYVMGPWMRPGSLTGYFEYRPIDRVTAFGFVFTGGTIGTLTTVQIPRWPVPVAAGDYRTELGPIGLWVNGTSVYGQMSGHSYSPAVSNIVDGLGVWNTDAFWAEGETFDHAHFHQPGRGEVWGQHHAHIDPIALRWQLGDHIRAHVDENDQPVYTALPSDGKHSPILGWGHDGIPIYGPFGFSVATNPASGVRPMRGGYVLRNGTHGSRDLCKTGRDKLPRWAMVVQGRTSPITAAEAGPKVSEDFPLGCFIEDWDYLGDLPGGGTFGIHWDLDQCNARWCVTPEFPRGTFAYFVTVDETMMNYPPKFPYIMGPMYRGEPTGGEIVSPPSAATRYF